MRGGLQASAPSAPACSRRFRFRFRFRLHHHRTGFVAHLGVSQLQDLYRARGHPEHSPQRLRAWRAAHAGLSAGQQQHLLRLKC